MSITKKGESAEATQDVQEPKKFETLQDYKDDGWEVSPNVKLSYPPVYTLTKGDETITFRPKIKNMPKFPRKAEGGMVKKKKKPTKKSKLAGRLAMRGYGIARK